MNVLTRLANKLKGSGPQLVSVNATQRYEEKPIPVFQTLKPIVTREDFEFLRALRAANRIDVLKSFSVKLYPGRVDGGERVICERCILRRCWNYQPGVVLVHHSKEGLQLYGCGPCKDFLIRMAC